MTLNADVSVLSAPTALTVGVPFGATFRVINTGNVPLDPAQHFRLGSQQPQDTGRWGRGRVEFPAAIPPGQSVDWTVDGFVPQEAGTFQFAWLTLQEGVRWFGRIAQSIQVTVASDPNRPPPPPPGLIVAPMPVSQWRGPYAGGGLCSMQVLNTGPFVADKSEKKATLMNDTGRNIVIYKVDDWLGVDMTGRMDTQLYAARLSDGCFLFLSPRDHYVDDPQGNFRSHYLPEGFVVAPKDGLIFVWFANGFSPAGVHAHYQTTLYYMG